MAVKLHRCSLMWFKADIHPCWRVQKALDEQGIEYEVVGKLGLPKSRRTEVIELTGQKNYPVVEFEDGSAYRDESARMAETIRAGKLFDAPRAGGRGGADGGGGGAGTAAASPPE